ncbi:YpjP family protein [Geobacillus icigianus]|uniref:YpjP family protein n=1 Tax=Geobacillus icigianus TaxID=1430331 RepID=UPI003899383F
MPAWLRKALVAAITVSTFGLVTPPASLLAAKEPPSDDASSPDWQHNSVGRADEAGSLTRAQFIEQTIEKAATQSHEKFGRKIAPVIEEEFRTVILPRIETVIAELAERYPEDELRYLAVSENPSGGQGERIFHLYRVDTGEDLLRFHVRREHPPQDGYWFQFHYHTCEDGFQAHYELGKIYWSKNTPPNWRT